MLWKSGLLLIKIYRLDTKFDRCMSLQAEQDIQHRVGILPSRETHHYQVAFFYHSKVGDSTTDIATKVLVASIQQELLFLIIHSTSPEYDVGVAKHARKLSLYPDPDLCTS